MMDKSIDAFHVKGADGVVRTLDEHYDGEKNVRQDPYGAWLAIQNLCARLAEVEAKLERAQSLFEPRDGERWVTPDMIEYQYEWMEWLAGDQPLVPLDDLRAVQAALATARRDALEEAAGRIEETMRGAIREYGPVKSLTDMAVIKMLEALVSAIRALIAQEEPTT